MALTYPRPSLTGLAWFALIPLFLIWSDRRQLRPDAVAYANGRQGAGQAALAGFAAGTAFHAVVLNWVYSTCLFAGTTHAVAALAWGSLSLFLGLNWALVGALGIIVTRRLPDGLKPWAWAALWTAVTAATERWTPRLAADIFAYSQNGNLALIQIGAIAGPHALGFLIIAWNAALAQGWASLSQAGAEFAVAGKEGGAAGKGSGAIEAIGQERFPAASLALVLAALAVCWVYGSLELLRREPVTSTARVEILQPTVDQYRKWDSAFGKEIEDGFGELLSLPRDKEPALVVWPESALTEPVSAEGPASIAAAWARKLKAAQVVGANVEAGEAMHGSIVLVQPDGRTAGVYNKRQLVPFGEFVPFEWLRAYIGILNQLGGLSPGEAVQPLFETPLGAAAGSVCYEAMFPSLLRGDAARGARVIFNVTNDGWYKDTWGPYQHFGANVYRAVENRATVVRAANTGVSGVIDPWGVTLSRLELGRRGRLDADVPLETAFSAGSFYSRSGDWLAVLCMAASGLLLALRRR